MTQILEGQEETVTSDGSKATSPTPKSKSSPAHAISPPTTPHFLFLPRELILYIINISNSLAVPGKICSLAKCTTTLLTLADWSLLLAPYLWSRRDISHPLSWFSNLGLSAPARILKVPPIIAVGAAKRLLRLGADPRNIPIKHDWTLSRKHETHNVVGSCAIKKGDVELVRLSFRLAPERDAHIWVEDIRSSLEGLFVEKLADYETLEAVVDCIMNDIIADGTPYHNSLGYLRIDDFQAGRFWLPLLKAGFLELTRKLLTGFRIFVPDEIHEKHQYTHDVYCAIGRYCDLDTFDFFVQRGLEPGRMVVGMLQRSDTVLLSHFLKTYNIKPNHADANYDDRGACFDRYYGTPVKISKRPPAACCCRSPHYKTNTTTTTTVSSPLLRYSGPLTLFQLAVGMRNVAALEAIFGYGHKVADGVSLMQFELPECRSEKWVQTLVQVLISNHHRLSKRDTQYVLSTHSTQTIRQLLHTAPPPTLQNPHLLISIMTNPALQQPGRTRLELLNLLIERGGHPTWLFKRRVEANEALRLAVVQHSSDEGAEEWRKECVEILMRLVNAGVRISRGRCPALLEAVVRGYTGIVGILLEGGADPNGCPALLKAVESGRVNIVRILLEGGADPNRYPNTLLEAVKTCQKDVVKMLLDAGVDPNGYSALSEASERRRWDIMEMLLESGAGFGGEERKVVDAVFSDGWGRRGDWGVLDMVMKFWDGRRVDCRKEEGRMTRTS
ncbi:hypothetical protein HDV00_009431 [Rhizophlyctis rosea]|nr:hypothetical protein HDV00_009431 [Rhizophlyctis rosea]